MNLAIIQNKVTQFDEPLYQKLFTSDEIDLMVYYTIPLKESQAIDHETGKRPSWRNEESTPYKSMTRQSGVLGGLKLLFKLLKGKYDLVIICSYNSGLFLLIAFTCFLLRIPIGLRSDNVMLYRGKTNWKWRIKDFIYPLFFKVFTTAHPTGSKAAEYFKAYGITDDQIFIFPYNVDNDELKRSSRESLSKQTQIRAALKINTTDRIVLGVLKFADREDPLTLLDGFELISREFKNLHLILVGDGPLREILEEKIRTAGLGNVHFPGYIPYAELPYYYGIADIFVHPVKVGSWEVSVNEAMACGVPVIASDCVGSSYDLIDTGKTGYVFEVGSPTSLAEKLRLVLECPDFKSVSTPYLNEKMMLWNYEQTTKNIYNALNHVKNITTK